MTPGTVEPWCCIAAEQPKCAVGLGVHDMLEAVIPAMVNTYTSTCTCGHTHTFTYTNAYTHTHKLHVHMRIYTNIYVYVYYTVITIHMRAIYSGSRHVNLCTGFAQTTPSFRCIGNAFPHQQEPKSTKQASS